ncbi:NAD(P)H-dependent oxidoreductase [Marixanthomonas ophiurae]|uniref:NAD(P)H-dependent oxidoreductase n=1 Tax=Marixanthomonas ophiurae TaxID=387659 RepID=A0A3E1Q8X6_9FLAO|nr:NAD(P)H-dependent oxidoreductase [Marixanthomonas ophiurae]RFN58585.1 NAD(P)H-dependent oxidoreductase [Marixanthomonas ophiurae]
MSKYLENLNWRYATKKFDTTKKINDTDLEFLKEAMQLSASSYGLQPYEILVIENNELREKLKPAAWNQSQITDASHLIVIANKVGFGDELIDSYIENVSAVRELPLESLSNFSSFMKSKIGEFSIEQKAQWAQNQSYIVLGNLLSAAAEIKVDVCPMEGFDAKVFNDILGLDKKGLNTAVIATIGYRSEEDETQHNLKVRKEKEELFTTI